MQFTFLVTTYVAAFQVVVCQQYWRSPFYRSIVDSYSECAQYLNISVPTVNRYIMSGFPAEPSTKQLVYCILIDLQAWNRTSSEIIGPLITAALTKVQYDEKANVHIQSCLNESLASIAQNDVLDRAHRSFLCYYQYYGYTIEGPHRLRYSNDDLKKFMKEAFLIQNVPLRSLQQYCIGNIMEQPDIADIALTYVLRAGFYSRERGYDLEFLYTQFDVPEMLSDEVKQCQMTVRRHHCEEPRRLMQTFMQCVSSYISWFPLVQAVAAELVAEAGYSCICESVSNLPSKSNNIVPYAYPTGPEFIISKPIIVGPYRRPTTTTGYLPVLPSTENPLPPTFPTFPST
ncbi:uncharacterized protein LOC129752720 [Uranotaenia lowii]|uniref:uncharacterized protein LOC129752720 n=1 Tax=Uranotaenia lowii TaxID=190385 RepID=UPI00247AF1A7|nr:uncharacterized protein LOC129752720 [Uranotaenia lowii]